MMTGADIKSIVGDDDVLASLPGGVVTVADLLDTASAVCPSPGKRRAPQDGFQTVARQNALRRGGGSMRMALNILGRTALLIFAVAGAVSMLISAYQLNTTQCNATQVGWIDSILNNVFNSTIRTPMQKMWCDGDYLEMLIHVIKDALLRRDVQALMTTGSIASGGVATLFGVVPMVRDFGIKPILAWMVNRSTMTDASKRQEAEEHIVKIIKHVCSPLPARQPNAVRAAQGSNALPQRRSATTQPAISPVFSQYNQYQNQNQNQYSHDEDYEDDDDYAENNAATRSRSRQTAGGRRRVGSGSGKATGKGKGAGKSKGNGKS
jgi:hypothetical protein